MADQSDSLGRKIALWESVDENPWGGEGAEFQSSLHLSPTATGEVSVLFTGNWTKRLFCCNCYLTWTISPAYGNFLKRNFIRCPKSLLFAFNSNCNMLDDAAKLTGAYLETVTHSANSLGIFKYTGPTQVQHLLDSILIQAFAQLHIMINSIRCFF